MNLHTADRDGAQPEIFRPTPKLEKIIINTVELLTATVMLQRGQMDAHTELNTPTMIEDRAGFADGAMLAKGHQFWLDSSRKPWIPAGAQALIMAVDTAQMFEVAS